MMRFVMFAAAVWVACGLLSVIWTLAVLRSTMPRVWAKGRRVWLVSIATDALWGPWALLHCVYYFVLRRGYAPR